MKIRNAVFNRFGTIDLEVEHPKLGWIPFTASPDDTESFGRDIYTVAISGDVAPYVEQVDLGNLKDSLKVRIDADAEAERLKYITPGSGQALAYLQKAMEATAYLAATDPDPADYPLLAAEVGITGETLADVAAIVDGQYQAWKVIGAAIEQARLGAKAAVDEAETPEDAQAAYDAIVWPSV